MYLKNLFSGLLILLSVSIFAENNPVTPKKNKIIQPADSVQLSIDYLKKYIQPTEIWQSDNPEILKLVNGLIHFTEDEHIDSALVRLERFQKQKDARYINRLPKYVSDSLQVRGYLDHPTILEKMKQFDREIWNGVDLKTIPLPISLSASSGNQTKPIAAGDEKAILKLTGIVLPDSLKNVNAVPDSMVHTANDFNRIRNRDQIRTSILEASRVEYNKNIHNLNG